MVTQELLVHFLVEHKKVDGENKVLYPEVYFITAAVVAAEKEIHVELVD